MQHDKAAEIQNDEILAAWSRIKMAVAAKYSLTNKISFFSRTM